MNFDLADDEIRALLNLLMDAIEDARYPLSPRIQTLRVILMKCGAMEGVSPDLAEKLRRYAPRKRLLPPVRLEACPPRSGP